MFSPNVSNERHGENVAGYFPPEDRELNPVWIIWEYVETHLFATVEFFCSGESEPLGIELPLCPSVSPSGMHCLPAHISLCVLGA